MLRFEGEKSSHGPDYKRPPSAVLEVVSRMSEKKIRELFTEDYMGGFTSDQLAELFESPDVAMLAAIERKTETGLVVIRGTLLGMVRECRSRHKRDIFAEMGIAERGDVFCDIKELTANEEGEIPKDTVLAGLITGVKELKGQRAWKYVTAFVANDDDNVDGMLEFFEQKEFQTRCRADGYRMVWPMKGKQTV